MPTLTNHQSGQTTKMLLIGESGSGKSGCLASLAKAGYNLRIIDFDNGLDVLAKLLAGDQKALERVNFITCTDKFKSVAGSVIVNGQPKAWANAMTSLDNWKDGNFGSVSSWGSDDVLVLDSLTFASAAAMRQVLFLNGKTNETRRIQDWGQAMDLTESLLSLLYSDEIKCNVIVTSHITYIERDDGLSKGYPSALGSKLPPKIGRYFNTILMTKSTGSGANVKRVIRTVTEGAIDLKTPIPGKLPPELPLETGLAQFFEAVRGGKPTPK